MAGALSRFVLRAGVLDPYPGRQLRGTFRGAVASKCGRMDVEMMASGSGDDPWARMFRSQSYSTLEGCLSRSRPWRFPPQDVTGLVVGRIIDDCNVVRSGNVFCFASECTFGRHPEFGCFGQVLRFFESAELFALRMHGQLIRGRTDSQLSWLVVKLDGCV